MPRIALASLLFLFAIGLRSEDGSTSPAVDFNRDIRPILSQNCYFCHGNDPKHRMADLRLDDREDALDHFAFVPGKPEDSLLIDRIHSDDADQLMPPPDSNKSLTDAQKELLRKWIAEGAPYAEHWAFVPPTKVDLTSTQPINPIDYFVEQKLRSASLTMSPQTELHTLIRRVSLDLTGIPPLPDEIDSFVQAASVDMEDAYSELVERLLSSPHYGERWGRWWLDQARYADSNGYSIDAPRQIWKYRDWVIQAINDDLPFDQFTIEQLAGDLLPNATMKQRIATGFHRNTQINQEGGIDQEQFRIDSVFDRVATTGTVWLGLTVGCAQCHDHKFDPIKQDEFYQLFAFLNNQDEPSMKVYDDDVDLVALQDEWQAVRERIDAFVEDKLDAIGTWETDLTEQERDALPGGVKQALEVPAQDRTAAHHRAIVSDRFESDPTYKILIDREQSLDQSLNQVPTTLVLQERTQPRKTHLLINGDFTRPADEVFPGTPAVLHPLRNADESTASPHGQPTRLDLANWIVDANNPLTARVVVNRIWQQYFGRGIVETENDFGLQGSPPSHPHLLDWLAVEFMERGWSLKQMHRTIVTSQTYRQSSDVRSDLRQEDPNNYLLARQQRLRLDAEIVRDVALQASGLWSSKIGGPSVFPPIPDGVMGQGQVKRAWNVSEGEDKFRRGMYTFVYRGSPPPTLSVFDAPEGTSTCTRRTRSNTPLQSLTLMNDIGFFEFALALEKIIQTDGLAIAFRRCTSRFPASDELAILQRLDTLNAARVLLNLDETVTRE